MATLSLGMIVKNEGDTIERVLGCAKNFCDEMVVVDTGSTDDTVEKAKAMGAIVHHFKWIDDFAAARNAAFELCTKEWVMWLDGDDYLTPESQAAMREIKRNDLNDSIDCVYTQYNAHPFMLWRERIIRRSLFGKTMEWKQPIHECIHGIDLARAKYIENAIITHDTPPDRWAKKEGRNISLLRKQYNAGTTDKHLLFLYAIECMTPSVPEEERERLLTHFFAMDPPQRNNYEINIKIYDYYKKENTKRAVDALGAAIVADPKRAEAYYKLAEHFYTKLSDPESAVLLLTCATQIKKSSTGSLEKESYGYGPWAMLARVYFTLEDMPQAQAAARKALKLGVPDTKWYTELLAYNPKKTYPPLPADWQDWQSGNFRSGGVAPVLLREMAEVGLPPGSILAAVAAERKLKKEREQQNRRSMRNNVVLMEKLVARAARKCEATKAAFKKQKGITYIGFAPERLSPEMGLEHFIRISQLIAAENSAIRFVIIGEASVNLDAMFDNYRVDRTKYIVTGALTGETLSATLQQADFFLYPLVEGAAHWNFFEMLLRGKIVIASDYGFLAEMIADNHNGYLRSLEHPQHWSALALDIAKNIGRYALVAKQARASVRAEDVANKYPEMMEPYRAEKKKVAKKSKPAKKPVPPKHHAKKRVVKKVSVKKRAVTKQQPTKTKKKTRR